MPKHLKSMKTFFVSFRKALIYIWNRVLVLIQQDEMKDGATQQESTIYSCISTIAYSMYSDVSMLIIKKTY